MFVCVAAERGVIRIPPSPFEGLRLPEPRGSICIRYMRPRSLGGRMAITETYVVRDWRLIWDANRAVLDLFDWSSLQLNELW